MTSDQQSRLLKFSYFLVGITVPIATYFLWVKTNGFHFGGRRAEIDRAHDITVEDSFPASDPPSAW
ncbi:MAG TPA: hypothetical protein VH351_05080 [Bryobacteraceae bacterium]|nr:hypothetical protein [Bryobacteraceae bacterium]